MKWVTREKARVDRIACPWLMARQFSAYDALLAYCRANEQHQAVRGR
jgi:hypothetical protein